MWRAPGPVSTRLGAPAFEDEFRLGAQLRLEGAFRVAEEVIDGAT